MSEPSMEELRRVCTRAVNGHGNRSESALLAEIPTDLGADRYGEGGSVSLLEAEMCSVLRKPAAVFMPSGTMAQQIALRIHADRRGSRSVAFHPTSHLELHEEKAYQRLHGLVGIPAGNAHSLITIEDLAAIREPLAAVLLELPQREIGGRLPEWTDLVAQCAFVRERGAAVHLDGARLWECAPYYGKELHEIAALFDSVYVSFYKGLGGLSGCCLAGEEDVIAEARAWRHRQGGTLFALWPLAASALAALRKRLPMMPAYYEHAIAIAAALRTHPLITIVPDPPQTPMMHLHVRVAAETFAARVRALAEGEGIWTWPRSSPTATADVQAVELTVGDATLELSPEEIASVFERLLD